MNRTNAKPKVMLAMSELFTLLPEDQEHRHLEFARIAEGEGIEGLFVSEHVVMGPSAGSLGRPDNPRQFVMPGMQDPATPWPSPLIKLAAMAGATSTIRIISAALIAPLRHPITLAKDLATLDLISNGRFELGLAKSGGKEWETFGVNPDTARDQVRDAMHMIPRMWTEPEFAWTSDDYQVPPREVTPKPLQRPHPRLWQTCGSPESFYMAGEMGVGALGTTLLSPVAFLGQMLREHDRGLADCKAPAGKVANPEKGVFTFVHVAESRAEAIRNGAAWSALWYVNAAPIVFKVPRRIWYDMIKAGLHPNSARDTAAMARLDPHEVEIQADDPDVVKLLKRMAVGEEISFEAAHDALEPLDSVVIGEPDHCIEKLKGYVGIGADRMMCLMQFGSIPHAAVMKSFELAGRHLVPTFAEREPELTA